MTQFLVTLFSPLLSSMLTAGILILFYRKREQDMYRKHRSEMEDFKEQILTSRERQLKDARRENMPRDDSGPPARVRPAFSRIPPRNP